MLKRLALGHRFMNEQPDAGGEGGGGGEPTPNVSLTQEQIQGIVDKAFARGAKNGTDPKALADALASNSSLQEELDALKKASEDAAAAGGGGSGGADDSDALKAAKIDFDARLAQANEEFETRLAGEVSGRASDKAASDTAVTNLRRSDLERQVVLAAASAGARDPAEVFTLLDATDVFEYDSDSDGWIVKDAKGRPRLDIAKGAEPMEVAAAVAEYLDAKPHHLRGSGRTGSGQGGGSEAAGSTSDGAIDTSKMSATEIFQKRKEILAGLGSRS